ncbi:MAG: OsmC family protein [Deltaproteobacteria bacterium]|nr:OsmC family protein [Deltaproteobacteria bacterium]MCL5793179.1 OsmC family protein [Deltaproteobacteria bacterium]
MSKAEIKWEEGMKFTAVSDSGHAVVLDAAKESKGTDAGARPMELLLMGLGGCTGMDVVYILNKMRKKVKSFKINIDSERAAQHPKVYTKINIEYIIEGDMDETDVGKAVELSQKRYCSASAMLGKVAELNYTYRLIKTGSIVS